MLRMPLLDMYFQFCKTHPEATVFFSPQSHYFIQHLNQQKSGIEVCFHWVKNISSALCYSLHGKTQKCLSHAHFRTAMPNQMWDQIYCKRLLLAHESSRKSLMPWAQFGVIIASLVNPMRFIISHNFDTSPVETRWIFSLFDSCQGFRMVSFPQQRH